LLAAAALLLGLGACASPVQRVNSDVEPVSAEQIDAVRVLLDAGDVAEAETTLTHLVARFPKSVVAQRTLQDLHRESVAGDEFVARYRRRAEQKPNEALGWYLLGRAVIDDESAAREHFERALALDPLNPWPSIGIAYLYRSRGDLFKTVETYRAALAAAPRSARLRWFFGSLYMDLQLYVDALRELEIAQRLDPENPQVWTAMGRSYLGLKNYGEARRYLLLARNAEPNQVDLYPALTQLYLHWRCPAQAVGYYRDGLDYGVLPAPELEGRVRALQLVAEEDDSICREPAAR